MKFVKERKTNTCACSFLLFSFLILAIILSILWYIKSFEYKFSVAENCIVQNRTILKRYQIAPDTQSGSDDDSSKTYADSCDLQDTANYIFHFHLNYKANGKSYENTKAYDWDESCYELRGIGCSQIDCNGTKSDTGTNDIVLPKNDTYNTYTVGDVIDCWFSEKNNSLIYINDPSTNVTGFYYVVGVFGAVFLICLITIIINKFFREPPTHKNKKNLEMFPQIDSRVEEPDLEMDNRSNNMMFQSKH